MFNNIPSRIVLFDGVCNLCNRSVRFIIDHDPEALFCFASLQSEEGRSILESVGLDRNNFDSFVYVKDGKAYVRSTAALMVSKELGGTWQLVYAFMIVPRPLRDLVYNLIAKYRYRIFGKSDACMVPTADLRRRFLPLQ